MKNNKSSIIFGNLSSSVENLVEDIDNTEAQKIVGGASSSSSSSSSSVNGELRASAGGFGNFGSSATSSNGTDTISVFRSRSGFSSRFF